MEEPMDCLRDVARRIDTGLLWLACAAAVLMMAQISVDVLFKFVLGRPVTATIEIVSTYYMVALVFLPLAFVDRTSGHISADLLTRTMTPGLRTLVLKIMDLLVLITLGLLFWYTLEEAIRRTAEGEMWRSGEFLLPVWPSRWLLPIGSGMMALSALIRLIDRRPPRTTTH
jgi:TRAP-type C4-dicarboxylate transport system permease small subunit